MQREFLSLPGLEALLRLVDDIDASLATHEAVVAMTVAQGFQRITDFHDITKRSSRVGARKMNALYASNRRRDQEHAAIGQGHELGLTRINGLLQA